jgi:hypothetical protein
MTVDGTWDIAITTPMGVNRMSIDFATAGDAVTGIAHTIGGDAAVEEGALEGNRLTYAVQVAAPFPMRLTMDLEVDGDRVTGTSSTGNFPPAPVEGARRP